MDPVRVMVVDDAADARFLIGLVLRDAEGVEVVAEAADADAALALLDEGIRPEVALLDARMPVVDGFELCRLLRARHPGLRIALLTAVVDEVIAEEARAAGAHACLSKGDLEELAARVRALARAS